MAAEPDSALDSGPLCFGQSISFGGWHDGNAFAWSGWVPRCQVGVGNDAASKMARCGGSRCFRLSTFQSVESGHQLCEKRWARPRCQCVTVAWRAGQLDLRGYGAGGASIEKSNRCARRGDGMARAPALCMQKGGAARPRGTSWRGATLIEVSVVHTVSARPDRKEGTSDDLALPDLRQAH
jgi:hypothetical protein